MGFLFCIKEISIHALLAESDLCKFCQLRNCNFISIHALLAESDLISTKKGQVLSLFLSTLSLRRATKAAAANSATQAFLSTLSLRRATLSCTLCTAVLQFLSTLSLRRATALYTVKNQKLVISIHALLAESDRLPLNGRDYKTISIHALLAESDSKSAQNSRALLRGRDTFYGIGITILAVIGSFYPFCPCFFHIFWCEGTGGFMIAFPSH